MTFGFDFDQLEEEDGVDEEQDQVGWPEEFVAGSESPERSLPDVVCRGFLGRPRGLCRHCQCCRGWAPSSSSTGVPREPRPADSGEAATEGFPLPLEARGVCLPSLSGAMPSFDGSRFKWPANRHADHGGRSESGNWGESRPCARCGCPEKEHEDVQAKFGRFLSERESIPLEALHWSQLELALWADTEGVFWPGGRRTYCADGSKPGVLVSVICPTTGSRSCFHPFLWHCFEKQDHRPRELVVIDTSEGEPSAFLEEKARSDKRLLYKHFRVPEKKWCIGLKRNLACYYATGEVIAHFDDDDMYAPVYLAVMLKCLRDPKEAFILRAMTGFNNNGSPHELPEMFHALNLQDTEHGVHPVPISPQAQFWVDNVTYGWGAACAKLCAWFNFSLQNRAWCHCDATDTEVPLTKDSRQEIYGWGFSLVYLRLAWQASPFLHIDLGEDLDFVYSFREIGLPLVLLPDRKGICAHTQHLQNISGLCMKGGSQGITPSSLLYSPLASVLSWYDMSAQGFCKYQEKLKEGTADQAIEPGLLLTSSKARPLVKPVVEEPKAEPEWMPGMKWTKAAVINFQRDILEGVLEEHFQKELHGVWWKLNGQPRKQEVQRRSLCLNVQGPILEKYGFEGSSKGLFQSSIECRLNDPQIGMLDSILTWLTHPGHKVWQVAGKSMGMSLLAAFQKDPSLGALHVVFTDAHRSLMEIEGGPDQRDLDAKAMFDSSAAGKLTPTANK